jgi:hypothetical protein
LATPSFEKISPACQDKTLPAQINDSSSRNAVANISASGQRSGVSKSGKDACPNRSAGFRFPNAE